MWVFIRSYEGFKYFIQSFHKHRYRHRHFAKGINDFFAISKTPGFITGYKPFLTEVNYETIFRYINKMVWQDLIC